MQEFDEREIESFQMAQTQFDGRRNPDWNMQQYVNNAEIEDISIEGNTGFVTISYVDNSGGPGRGPDGFPGRGPGGPGRGPDGFPGRGPGGPGRGPDGFPGRGPGPGFPGGGPGPVRRPRRERVRLVVTRQTSILDERGNPIRIWQLEVGMRVNAAFSQAMTRSIPPQATAFQIVVISRPRRNMVTAGRILEVNVRNQFITTISEDGIRSIIRFNVSPQTVIRGRFGQVISLNELRPGFRVRVEHATFMTPSIPPQTAAYSIQVL